MPLWKLPQFCIRSDLLRAWRSVMEYYCIGWQADAQWLQWTDDSSICNAHSSARSSYECSRSPYLEEIHQSHGPFWGIPITVAPSQSHCRWKWRLLPLNPASKRQWTGNQETCSDDIHILCLDTGYTPVNSLVMYEGQAPDEQVHALAAPVNPSHIDGNSTFTAANTHQPIREASKIPSQKQGYQNHNLLLQPSNREPECLGQMDISGEGNHWSETRANHTCTNSVVPNTVKPRYSELRYSEIFAITRLPRSQNYFAI